MRTITKSYTVYKYEELSNAAKEKARQEYLNGQESYFFTENCLERLKELFPNSELEVEYSLSYCQGDGFNIYGKIYLDEVLEYIKEQFTEKELRFFKWMFDNYGSIYEMKSNNYYSYCICSRNDFAEIYLDDMQMENMRDIPEATLEKFNKTVGEYLDNLCKEFEKDGYAYFYEVSEDDLKEWAEANEYEFYENGKIAA